MLSFTVQHEPIPQPRPRVYAGHAVSNTDRVTSYKLAIQYAARKAGARLLDGPLSVMLTFIMPRPAAMRWKTKPMPREHHAKRPDVDNLAKAVLDALTGIAWKDDGQIASLLLYKMIAAGSDKPCVAISVVRV